MNRLLGCLGAFAAYAALFYAIAWLYLSAIDALLVAPIARLLP